MCEEHQIPWEAAWGKGKLIAELFEKLVEHTLIQPTFVTDFPLETSPLAKKSPENGALVRRFEIYVGSAEIGNAFSEINDPIDQRERFIQQGAMRAGGDVEAHPMDEDFLRALEFGMPPSGGVGMGIDRLLMNLTGLNIRETILFPLVKPE